MERACPDSTVLPAAQPEHLVNRADSEDAIARMLAVPALATGGGIDPVFAAIDENRRLLDAWTAAIDLPVPQGRGSSLESEAAQTAWNAHSREVLLTTRPTMVDGCKALARYALGHFLENGFALDEDGDGNQHLRVLDLIARAPLLESGVGASHGEPSPDAALLAMEPGIAALIAAGDRITRDLVACEELIHELTMPVPVKPGDIQLFPTDAAYHEAMRRWERHHETWTTRLRQARTATRLSDLEDAQADAETAILDACAALAEQRATTLDGLRLKARFAERGNWDALSRSIVADLLAGLAPPVQAPAAALTNTASDLGLTGLFREFDAAARLREAAHRRLNEAEARIGPLLPEHPELLVATNFDLMDGFPRPTMGHDLGGRTWTPGQIEQIRSAPPRMVVGGRGAPKISETTARRKVEILTAYDAYAEQVKAAEDASGLAIAEAESDRLFDVCAAIADRIAGTPATTLEGLTIKARAFVEACGEPVIKLGGALDENLAHSVLLDLLAMGEAA